MLKARLCGVAHPWKAGHVWSESLQCGFDYGLGDMASQTHRFFFSLQVLSTDCTVDPHPLPPPLLGLYCPRLDLH